MCFNALQYFGVFGRVFVAALYQPRKTLDAFFDRLEVGKRQLGVNRLDISRRIDGVSYVGYVAVFEAAHDVSDRVGFADVSEKLVAKAFAFRSARDEAGD